MSLDSSETESDRSDPRETDNESSDSSEMESGSSDPLESDREDLNSPWADSDSSDSPETLSESSVSKNELEVSAPSPMSKEQVKNITIVNITEEQVRKSLECSVCLERYKLQESVQKLWCSHLFS